LPPWNEPNRVCIRRKRCACIAAAPRQRARRPR
jgi:hypothetical protein